LPATAKSRFDAVTVVALRLQNDARCLEITFADGAGIEHVVSLPIQTAVELANFISDATSFMTRLKQRPEPSSEG
jgi:hypothetical protein